MSYLDAQGRWGEVEERHAFGLLDDGADAAIIRDRAINLERNNALARSVLDRAVENFVGPRIALRPATSSPAFNEAVERRQKFYFSGCRMDVRRLDSFDGLVRLAVRSLLRDGDDGFALVKAAGRPQLQFIEGGLIDQPSVADTNVRDGIEWGSNGQPLAFYVRAYDEYGTFEHRRIAARDFIYLRDHTRGSASRGISRFTGSFSMFNNLAGYVDAAVKTARTQNAQAILAEEDRPGTVVAGRAGNATVIDADGNAFRTIPIEGGAINIVKNVKGFTAFQPTAPGANLDMGVSVFGRFLGLAFAMPYDDVFLDYSKSNYSNSRMRRLAMGVAIDLFQQYLKTALFDRFWPWFVSRLVKNGEIVDANGQPVPPPPDAWEYEWTPPARPSNDPLKEAQAAEKFIAMNVEARQNIAESMGYDWPTLLATIKRNREELKAAGAAPGDEGGGPKEIVDAYGIGVRAGAVTPQMPDEERVRQSLGFPPMGEDVKAAWLRDGVRRPITITEATSADGTTPAAGAAPSPAGPPADPDEEETDEDPDEEDDDAERTED